MTDWREGSGVRTYQIRVLLDGGGSVGLALVDAPDAGSAIAQFELIEYRARAANMAEWNGVGCPWYPIADPLRLLAVLPGEFEP